MRTFAFIWAGQVFSILGSNVSLFAVGVWVYQRSGSATLLALIALFGTLPGIVLSPLAGALIDRWDRRRVILLADCGEALATGVLALFLWSGSVSVWPVYLATTLAAISSAFHGPAFEAAIATLVPPRHLGRAAGMVSLAHSVATLMAPAIGGVLVQTIPLAYILLIDLATYLLAVAPLLVVRFPPHQLPAPAERTRASLAAEISAAWRFLRGHGELVRLLVFFGGAIFLEYVFTTLTLPLVLGFGSEASAGAAMAVAGAATLIGSLAVSLWGGPQNRWAALFVAEAVIGIGMITTGLGRSLPIVLAGLIVASLPVPLLEAASQVVWQTRVPAPMQGRVFALRRGILQMIAVAAYLSAGLLADHLFGVPLLVSLAGVAGIALAAVAAAWHARLPRRTGSAGPGADAGE